jgi:hypothetical protein
VEEVLNMTKHEFIGWAAFYKIESDESKKAMNRSR